MRGEGEASGLYLWGPGDLSPLEEAWNVLARRNPAGCFMSFAWSSSAYESFYREAERFLLVSEAPGRFIAPLARVSVGILPRANKLQFVGAGFSDYQDFLAAERNGAAGGDGAWAEALLGTLCELGGWNLLDLDGIRDDSPTCDELRRAFAACRLDWVEIPSGCAPYLRIGRSWESLIGDKKRKFRYNLERSVRRLQAAGLEFRVHSGVGPVRDALPGLIELHGEQWRGRYTSNLLAKPNGAAFATRAAERLALDDSFLLAELSVGGELAAAAYCFWFERKLYYYTPAYSPKFGPYSPGTALLYLLLQWAADRGCVEFDFLKGDEPYKAHWASGKRELRRFIAAYPNRRSAAVLHSYVRFLKIRSAAVRSTLLRKWADRMSTVSRRLGGLN